MAKVYVVKGLTAPNVYQFTFAKLGLAWAFMHELYQTENHLVKAMLKPGGLIEIEVQREGKDIQHHSIEEVGVIDRVGS